VTLVGAQYYGTGMQGDPAGQTGAPIVVVNALTRAQSATIPLATDAGASAQFGSDISCSADGSVVVVGAQGTSTGTQVGAAYVYAVNSAGAYALVRGNLVANATGAAAGAFFGSAVAVDATGAYALVCAGLFPVVSGSQAGKCYIYSGAKFGTVTPVVVPSGISYAGLGQSAGTIKIALLGGTQVVAIMGVMGAGGAPGAAIVTVYTAANMSLAFPPFAVSGKRAYNDDYFGGAMIATNGDGTRLFFGASGNAFISGAPTSTSAARTYVDYYTVAPPLTSAAGLVFRQTITMASAPAGFGIGIGVSTDSSRLVVGAALAGAPVAGSSPFAPAAAGAVYTFALNATGLYAYESTVTSPAPTAGDMFGYWVGTTDKTQLLVSAPGASPFGAAFPASGAVYNYPLYVAPVAPAKSGAAAAAHPAAAAAAAAAVGAVLLAARGL